MSDNFKADTIYLKKELSAELTRRANELQSEIDKTVDQQHRIVILEEKVKIFKETAQGIINSINNTSEAPVGDEAEEVCEEPPEQEPNMDHVEV